MNNLKRVEIIANHSIESDIMEILEQRNLAAHFTKIPNVQGRGDSEPKRGDHIWPESNFILIIYCSEEDSAQISESMEEIKQEFPNEGIRCFIST